MNRIKVMVNGLPGNMASNVVKHALNDDRFEMIAHSLTGPEITETETTVDSTTFLKLMFLGINIAFRSSGIGRKRVEVKLKKPSSYIVPIIEIPIRLFAQLQKRVLHRI